jgi:hypothetical protein
VFYGFFFAKDEDGNEIKKYSQYSSTGKRRTNLPSAYTVSGIRQQATNRNTA